MDALVHIFTVKTVERLSQHETRLQHVQVLFLLAFLNQELNPAENVYHVLCKVFRFVLLVLVELYHRFERAQN